MSAIFQPEYITTKIDLSLFVSGTNLFIVYGLTITNNFFIVKCIILQKDGRVEEGMKIKTRALRQEVCHVPAPEGIDYEDVGTLISDGDISCYSRPEIGNHVLIGSEDPECDGRGCNIGFYSRLREINPASSFSVVG